MKKIATLLLTLLSSILIWGNTWAATPQIDAGDYFSLGLKSDGTLWAWGENDYGALGDGTTIERHSPVQTGSDSDWVSTSGGEYHTLGIKSDGTLWAWGSNWSGQLGDGTTTDRLLPVQIGSDSDWAAIAAGGYHSLGLKSDGTLWAWGSNNQGKLGDGTGIDRHSPVQIGSDSDWGSIAAAYTFSLGLKSDGTLWAWGDNSAGTLGDGTTTSRYSPVQIGSDSDWISISTQYLHTLGLKSDGTLWAWGRNRDGQLGDGTTTDRLLPVQIGSDSDWAAIAAGGFHSLGLKSDGTLWAWGSNWSGQLGDGTTTDRHSPDQIGSDSDWAAIDAGFDSFSLGHKSDGTLWAWGYNGYGNLGDGTTTARYSPVFIMTIGVASQPPVIDNITGPAEPVNINDQPVTLTVEFSGPETADVTWNWGDDSSDTTQIAASSPASANYTYAYPGVYTVMVTIDDSVTESYEYVVIYDPEGGFVTGGGWINSPAGACQYDACTYETTGKANFGFVSKYKKNATIPTGQTQFQFKAGDLNFHSDSYEWLVVAGKKAMYKGTGTINSDGNYGFKLMAVDEALTPSTDVDLFRIKIWDKDYGDYIVYDNEMAVAEDADPTTEIGGGNIKVHNPK